MKKELLTQALDQVNFEFESSYLYLSMAAWAAQEGYPGTAKWMELQAKEEVEHALKMVHFLQDVNEVVEFKPIASSKIEFPGFIDLFKLSLEHEKKVTARIHALYEAALAEKMYPMVQLYDWFIKEQLEEERTFEDIIVRLEKVPTPIGIMMMDDRLSQRA
mgnify:CR=1 FL=1